MFSNTGVIKVNKLGKCYQIYENPRDRLLQMITRNHYKLYKEFWALKDVSFQINPGETVGIIGLNGSGKSTLLQLICRILNPTTGSISTSGRIAALLELGAGFNHEYTGRENIFLCAALYGLSKEETESRFDAIARFAEIGDFIDRPVKTYSSGMFVRLAFSVIANIDADILVIDEALAVGDAYFSQKCMRFLREYRERGTLLFVSHDNGAIVNICTRALWLNNGILLMDSIPKDVSDAYLANLYELQQGKSDTQFQRKIDLFENSTSSESRKPAAISFNFNALAPSFGNGHAVIENVTLTDPNGKVINRFIGNEPVELCIKAAIGKNIKQPIAGFQIKDRLGQVLLGDNSCASFLNKEPSLKLGDTLIAVFKFIMPVLQVGYYTITVAIANGTIEHHVQLHWIHDALMFEMKKDKFCGGLVGLETSIDLTVASPVAYIANTM